MSIVTLLTEGGLTPFCILGSGSYFEGLATFTSDIDLIAVCQSRSHELPKLLRGWHEAKKYEVLAVDIAEYEALVSGTSRWSIGGHTVASLDVRRRVLFSLPIYGASYHNARVSEEIVAAFLQDRREFRRAIAFKAYSDFRGVLQSGDEDLKVVRARALLEKTVDLLLIELGDNFDRPKWRIPRISRTFKTDKRLTSIGNEVVRHLSGTSFLLHTAASAWVARVLTMNVRLEFLAHFLDQWPRLLTESDLTNDSIEPALSHRFGTIAKGLDGMFRIQSLGPALQVPPHIAFAIGLFSLPIREARVSEILDRYFLDLADRTDRPLLENTPRVLAAARRIVSSLYPV